jgi:ABC-type transport system involved in cytochrome c biogenesis permease subunit
MATADSHDRSRSLQNEAAHMSKQLDGVAMTLVRSLASLKLTCVLFVLAMIVVFVGSLAQSRRDVWQVMEQYFRTYLAWIDVRDVFPPSMFGDYGDRLAAFLGPFRYVPFPGGWTIGWIMLANLMTAHMLKFRVQVRGGRMIAGISLIVLGLLMTAAVVFTGNQQTGVETGNTILGASQIWTLLLAVIGVAGAASCATSVLARGGSMLTRGVLLAIGATLIGVLLYFIIGGEAARLNLSSMRILWQLLKGSACSLVLLIGSVLLFEKRGGIALLHFGVAMLMISELQVGLLAKENMLSLVEGETSVFVRDVRERELAIITPNTDGTDRVIVIPEARLQAAAEAAKESASAEKDAPLTPGQVISLPSLPFDVGVRTFLRNSRLRAILPDDTLRATSGLGSFASAEPLDPVTGMDDSHDQSTVLVEVIDRKSGKPVQSLLVAQNVSELRGAPLAETASVDGKDFYFYLRFQRNYRDYEVKLLDVSRTNYVGSSTPRDYRSVIEITNPDDGSKDQFTVWMNNPLRYRGETFYQSGYTPLEDGKEASTISVVNNTGWMLPYIACMIVSFGMFAQFGQTLFRFLDRTERTAQRSTVAQMPSSVNRALPAGFAPAVAAPSTLEEDTPPTPFVVSVGIPVLVTLLFAAWIGSKMRPPKDVPGTFNLYSFAQLPIAWNGRAQPIDSVARAQLLVTSHKSTFEGELERSTLSQPEQRVKILNTFRRHWPSAPATELEKFEGTYSEWIDKIASITSASRESVEERMRAVMVRKMAAVQWFLDVITRPEFAARHRVIKVEDDQLLSLMKLEKRGGLTYSLAELQPNLDSLDDHLKKARQKQRDKQENTMTTLERRVAALFDSVSRVDQLSQMFMMRESDGLLSAFVDSWRVLQLLGNEPAVMAVPTGSSDEQRSWETMVGSNTLRQLATQMKKYNISNYEQLKVAFEETLPREIVTESIVGSYTILKDSLPPQSGDDLAQIVHQRAAEAALQMKEPFLQQVLKVIGEAAPGTAPEEIAKSLSSEQVRQIASERVTAEMNKVFAMMRNSPQDEKRLEQLRQKLQAIGTEDEQALTAAVNTELIRLAWDDISARAGHLLPGGESSETFLTTSTAMHNVLTAWQKSDVKGFNESVDEYRDYLASGVLPHVNLATVKKEAWFNFFEPFYLAINLYLPIIVLSFCGWLFFGNVLRRTSLLLLLLAFAVHSMALVMRMQISGRPPVTNLYSSAIFIGWAVVVAAFVVEMFLKNGIGNILGASVGAGTLVIAHYLARDEGDTLGVMQAVLDTTFWLATHVVCITLGYAATFAAGFLGLFHLFYIASERARAPRDQATEKVSVRAVALKILSPVTATIYWIAARGTQGNRSGSPISDILGKMIYGILCFALFFSLVGTVLGGLWADDSWGRFWGWDPKENGAMLIVLWNAVILHARWDKMIGNYGTAVLAMVGNVVTAWSWFGVNELKAGLHTYGFTEGRLLALGIFVVVQLALVLAFAFLAPLMSRRASRKSAELI